MAGHVGSSALTSSCGTEHSHINIPCFTKPNKPCFPTHSFTNRRPRHVSLILLVIYARSGAWIYSLLWDIQTTLEHLTPFDLMMSHSLPCWTRCESATQIQPISSSMLDGVVEGSAKLLFVTMKTNNVECMIYGCIEDVQQECFGPHPNKLLQSVWLKANARFHAKTQSREVIFHCDDVRVIWEFRGGILVPAAYITESPTHTFIFSTNSFSSSASIPTRLPTITN